MIPTEHQPAVAAALARDREAWLNVGSAPSYSDGIGHGPRRDAPPDWAEDAAAVCRCVCHNPFNPITQRDSSYPNSCPDCHGTGKPVHALTAECPGKCRGSGVVGDWEGSAIECPRCDGDGTVTARYVVAELVRYVSCVGAFADIWDNIEQPAVLWKPDNVYGVGPKLLRDNVLTSITAVIGNPQPGDYIAHLEAVT